jgi:large subunit ribosomal protein L13
VRVGLKTFNLKKEEIKRKWFLVDAEDRNLGRLCTEIAKILRGKNKPTFTPHLDCGDFVVVINADKVKVTGNKLAGKTYYRHSGYIGNLKSISLDEMMKKSPETVIRNAVRGMLPHNILGRKILKKLKIYRGNKNPYKSQKPEKIDL